LLIKKVFFAKNRLRLSAIYEKLPNLKDIELFFIVVYIVVQTLYLILEMWFKYLCWTK